MRLFISILISLFLLTFQFVSPATAALWGDDTLVTIDGSKYTTEDFKRWWGFWNDKDLSLPETPDFYIDWLLLAREGERMQLEEDPAFQRRTEVFLKVRALLMLQKEEIFDKINVSEKELRARYEKLYTPIWLLERLQFADENAAQTAWQEIKNGTLTIDELKALPQQHGGPEAIREDWRRPVGISEYWADVFKKLKAGEATEPVKDLDFYVFYFVKERDDGDAKDFEMLRKKLSEQIREEQKNKLTGALLTRLRKKFDVHVDQERLANLALDKPADDYGDEPIITTNRRNFSEKEFMALLRQDQKLRPSAAHNKTFATEVKNRVVNGILSQNLTDWEALDRHYEEKEPLKWEYQFNIRHRLTTEVQNRLFASEVTVSEDEIKKYFTENISHYTQPEIVNLVLIKDSEGTVDRIWGEVAAGKDFFTAVRENTEQKTTPQAIPFMHLDPPVQKVVAGLSKGETSPPFEFEGQRFIVHLTSRTPAEPLPLEKVAGNIRSTLLQKKIAQKRKEYLDLLKTRSVIKVNESNWQSVQKELGGNK